MLRILRHDIYLLETDALRLKELNDANSADGVYIVYTSSRYDSIVTIPIKYLDN